MTNFCCRLNMNIQIPSNRNFESKFRAFLNITPNDQVSTPSLQETQIKKVLNYESRSLRMENPLTWTLTKTRPLKGRRLGALLMMVDERPDAAN